MNEFERFNEEISKAIGGFAGAVNKLLKSVHEAVQVIYKQVFLHFQKNKTTLIIGVDWGSDDPQTTILSKSEDGIYTIHKRINPEDIYIRHRKIFDQINVVPYTIFDPSKPEDINKRWDEFFTKKHLDEEEGEDCGKD